MIILLLPILFYSCSNIGVITANLLIETDTVPQGEVIFVLGGLSKLRAKYALEIAKKTNINKIITLGADTVDDLIPFGYTITFAEACSLHIKSMDSINSITVEAIPVATSTWEEINFINHYMDSLKIKSAIIVSTLLHTRRIKWTISKVIKDNKKITVTASPYHKFHVYKWYETEEGTIAYINECIKFIYYLIKY